MKRLSAALTFLVLQCAPGKLRTALRCFLGALKPRTCEAAGFIVVERLERLIEVRKKRFEIAGDLVKQIV